jgi:hypothetical protein
MISVILVVCAIMAKYFAAAIPLINGAEFEVIVLAHLVLVIGCLIRAV